MNTGLNTFYNGLINFTKKYSYLCVSVLGLVIVGAVVKQFGGKIASWIRETAGQAAKTQFFSNLFFKKMSDPKSAETPKTLEPRSIKPVDPIVAQPTESLTPSSPIQKNLTPKEFWKKMQIGKPDYFSTTRYGESDYGLLKDEYMKTQVEKLLSFLENEKAKNCEQLADLTYFTSGFGDSTDQIWPGFIFETLDKNQSTQIIGFEVPGQAYDPLCCLTHIKMQYEKYSGWSQKEKTLDNSAYSKISFNQFSTGYPCSYTQAGNSKKMSINNFCWPAKEKIEEAKNLIHDYIEKLLQNNKKVVLGWHCDRTLEIGELYNDFAKRYPGQIYFCIGHEGANVITNKLLDTKNYKWFDDPLKFVGENPDWSHFPESLSACKLPS